MVDAGFSTDGDRGAWGTSMGTGKMSGAEVYFISGCAVESDIVYLATQLEDVDSSEYTHTRMSVYVGRFEASRQWFYHDVDANIVSVCNMRHTNPKVKQLVALSKEGEVELWTNQDGSSPMEKTLDAGVRLGSLGYMRSIREIGSRLFACGFNSQVYERRHDGWISLTAGPLKYHHAASNDYVVFNGIDGFSESDVYVVGSNGKLYHWNGGDWRQIPLKTDENLECIRCYGADEVWIGGANGTLLNGNVANGFRDVSDVADKDTFWSLAKFKDKVYLGTTKGLFAYDGQAIRPVVTGLNPEVETYTVDSTTDALWSIGAKDLVRFDGQVWTRIDHPNNPPIRP
ncbi:hypothetical protein [Burkholderia ubonensis]|uniref:hypothetical protein n=1 Tax=Burkholderia ubonensis TaxID=101571 RepID=UPI000ADA333E|nr:hypothetical protein [Burkholderia ubonensis]